MFQFGQLVPELTVADNIALPLLLNRTGRKAAYAAADAWLPRLDMDGLGRRRTGELSGGQAQRVALARALVDAAERAVRRRADRLARHADRRDGDGPAGRHRPRGGRDGRPGDARRPGRRLRRPARSWCATARSSTGPTSPVEVSP